VESMDPGRRGHLARPRSQRYAIGWSSLTPAEMRVVRLVVAGLTNRQIASQLYLSWHTVNAHLRNVLLKLDLHSRVDLTRVAMQNDPRLAG
jgi:DNA-binding CsgD family transcriptional regulator